MKDRLKQWLDTAKLGPNQQELVKLLEDNCKDDEAAGLIAQVLKTIKDAK